jgi:hypothetical protein
MSGEADRPKNRLSFLASARMSVRQTGLPVAASQQARAPVMPNVYTLPSWTQGVARGPSPKSV